MNYYNEHDKKAAAWLRELISAGLIPDGHVDERSICDVHPDDLRGFTQCHFFAGIGGWSLALQLAGWSEDRPVWTGSCPCQPYSAAGEGKGDEDPRNLWPHLYRLHREQRPHVMFGEQVANAIGHGWLDRISTDLEAIGYACGAVVLGAHSVGSPHIRQRLYWVANAQRDAGGERRAPVEPGRCSVSGGMGNANSDGWKTRKSAASITGHGCSVGSNGSPCGMADSNQQHDDGSGHGSSPDSRELGGPEILRGFWSDFEVIHMLDGKARRVESGSQPLVARLPAGVVPNSDPSLQEVQATPEGRVMRLRGYGNAIVPQVAAEFILAWMSATSSAA